MADNVTTREDTGLGLGPIFATDQIGSVHYPKSKLVFGANDTATDVIATAGLPVTQQTSDSWVVDLGANNDVTIDGSSVVQTEDAVHGSGDTGIMALAVRNDVLAALAGTDGDYAPIQVNASGAVYVEVAASALPTGAATSALQTTGNTALSAIQTAVEGTLAVTGTVDLGANNDVTIDNSSIVHAEDSAHATGHAGVMSLAVRNDTLAALATADGDYAPIQVNALGAAYVEVSSSALPAGAATAANQSTANTSLSNIETAVQLIDNSVATISATDLLRVAIFDASDTQVTTFGGGTEYTEGDVDATIVGKVAMMEVAGNTLQPLQGSVADGLLVNLGTNNDVTITGTVAVDLGANNDVINLGTFAVQEDGAALTALQLLDNTVRAEDVASGTGHEGNVVLVVRDDALAAGAGVSTDGDYTFLRVDNNGALWAAISGTVTVTDNGSFTLGSNSGVDIGDVDVTSVVPGTGATSLGKAEDAAHSTGDVGVMALSVRNDVLASLVGADGDYSALQVNALGGLFTQNAPNTSGGLTMSKTISAATTNATSVKASAGQVYAVQVMNLNGSPRYLKLYNKASAPTVGTDTPVKTLMIPGNANGSGLVLDWDKGLEFTLGIAFALTTGIQDSDVGAVAANEITVNLDYK